MERSAGQLKCPAAASSVLHAPGPNWEILVRHAGAAPARSVWKTGVLPVTPMTRAFNKWEHHVSAALTFPAWLAGVVLFHQ